MVMRTHIVKIGNSQGIRIPKPILEQLGIVEDVDIKVEASQIIIRPILDPRSGWNEAFRKMAKNGDELPVEGDGIVDHSWDETEWEW
jgi:antitoxin MazE